MGAAFIFFVVIFVLLQHGNGEQSFLQVIEFGIDDRAENFIEVVPDQHLHSLDFSICLRCKFWSWGSMVLFETEFDKMWLYLGDLETNSGTLYLSEFRPFPLHGLKFSPTLWNSFCLVHNSNTSNVTIAINDYNDTYPLDTTGLKIEDINKAIFIGSSPDLTPDDFRFSGQISDFNYWNRVLKPTDVQDFMSGCSKNLFEQ